ncbi:hypothetical protein NSK_002515 [Nannochloropsis salina CCMP1776]|uniref:Uncharacterized protein n=1 Tax=Nannochloropsis salina CCMP1776 TaxID=1027361 RepID=A0A4D9D7F4_9STRA|nr:hypothetical protein NSK_002515 [Nannochloropsis salina CCMP1776]|eukprot:TFJ86307.1 hypothetical protein NSK_002515 [Nannochloropsis salina CCMP1776]
MHHTHAFVAPSAPNGLPENPRVVRQRHQLGSQTCQLVQTPRFWSPFTGQLRGKSGSSRLHARISEKPGDKQDREEGGEQGLPKVLEEGLPKLTRQQEEAVDLSMGVIPPEQEPLSGEAWTAEVEKRLQEMYEKGTYDPTPVNLTPKELANQQWVDDFLNKEERPIRFTPEYWFGTWTRGDIKFSSAGRGMKSFGFALVGIGLVTLMFLLEDELVNPAFDDYRQWDGNDFFHFGEDLGAWVTAIPARTSDYLSHFNWVEWSARVAARAGAAPRWQNQLLGLPAIPPQ